MNDKNNESNNSELSFKDKIKMFNKPLTTTKKPKNNNNDKNLISSEKNSQSNQFQNTLQLFNKKNNGINELSNIDIKNKKNSKIENEKNNINNKSIEKRTKKNEFLDINNLKETKITPKRNTICANPFTEENSKSKKSIKNEEKLTDKINKFNYADKNKEQNDSKINNNNLNKNKINKDIKEISNKFSAKSNNPKKDDKNNKLKKSENISNKNKSGNVIDLRKNILLFDQISDINYSHRETISNFSGNRNQQKKNTDIINKNKEKNKPKTIINVDFEKLQKKRFSIRLPLGRPLIDLEKIKITPEKKIKENKIKTSSPKFVPNPKKALKNKQINPFINESEKINQNNSINKIKNVNVKKKVVIKSPNKIETTTKSIEKKTKSNRANTIYVKNNKKEKIQEEILESIQISSDMKKNSFCKAFVATSIPKKEIKFIENSEGEKSCCNHEECAQLPAMEPRIIYKYPEKDTKELEISNVLSFLCFPNNIKICFNSDESKIIPSRNYRNCLTSQVGDRYYMMMYHFFVRISKKEFYEKYDIDTLKEKLENIPNIEYIYIPFCICLVSKNSFFFQMNLCLESIFLSLLNPNTKFEELKEFLSYLINSVPAPYINTSINFAIPNCSHLIELYPCFYQDIDVYLTTPIQLLDKLKPNNILFLLRLLLLEQKILLVSNDYNSLTQVSLNLISLLYPFSWINIYIPVITINLLKYLESFLPFFYGMHKSLYEKEIVKTTIYKSQRDLYIFDIDENTFEISRNIQSTTKANVIKYLDRHVPSFPKKIEDLIMNQLAILKSYYKNSVDNRMSFNADKRKDIISNCIKMKEVFIQAFIELFFEYKKYLSIIGDVPIFNTKSFIQDKTESEQIFFKEFTSTQIFQIFIQNSSNYINKINKKYYFDELIKDYLLKRNALDEKAQKNYFIIVNNEFENKMRKHLYENSKIYYVIPSDLKLFEYINDKLKDKRGIYYIEDLKSSLKNEFKYYNLLDPKGKLKTDKKIIYHDFNIFYNQSQDDIKYYKYFMTKEEKIEKEELKIEIKSKNKNNQEKELPKSSKNDDINKKEAKIAEEEISEIEKENIKDNIDSKLRKVFRAEKININEDSEVLLSSMETEFGKNYFLSLFKLNNNIKQVKFINEDSFQILFEVITKSLLKLSLNNPKDKLFAMKLLKSFIFYKKMNEMEEVSLIEKIVEYFSKKKFNLFKEEGYWELWVEEELKENNSDLFNKLKVMYENKESFYYYIDEEDEKVKEFKNKGKACVQELIKILEEVKINKSFILSVIEHLCDKFIQIDDFRSQMVSEIRGFGTETLKK